MGEVTLRLDQPASEVWFARDYLDQVEMSTVLPTPRSIRHDGDRCVFAFADPVSEVSLTLRFAGYRPRHGQAGAGDAQVAFTQWMLP